MDSVAFDIAIIGGGPAGLTAGLYAANAGMSAVVFESIFAGGKLINIAHIDNYPGFPNGVDGYTLAEGMRARTSEAGAVFINEQVLSVDFSSDNKKIITADTLCSAKAVIIATGAKERLVGMKDEEAFIGRGVSFCAVCDGALYKGKRVAVIGGGNTALSDAIYLAAFAEKVYVIHRRDTLRAVSSLQKSAMALQNIQFIYNASPTALLGKERVTGIKYHDKTSDIDNDLVVNGVFVAVGQMPNTDMFKDTGIITTDNGYIVTGTDTATSIRGVFAAGDVRETPLRQVITACADGAMAANAAAKLLRG